MRTDFDFNYDDQVNFNNFYYFHKAFSLEEIQKIHEVASAHEFITAVTDSKNEGDEDLELVRKSRIKWLKQSDPKTHWIYDKIGKMAQKANRELWKFDLTNMRESLQYTVYHKDSGHYDWHMDIAGGGIMTQRKISVTIELTDHDKDYEGGVVQVNLGHSIKELPQSQGTAVLFPSFFVHRVTPVTKGKRTSLVLWVGGHHYK